MGAEGRLAAYCAGAPDGVDCCVCVVLQKGRELLAGHTFVSDMCAVPQRTCQRQLWFLLGFGIRSNATTALRLVLVLSRWGGLLMTAGGHAVQFVTIGLCKDGDPG